MINKLVTRILLSCVVLSCFRCTRIPKDLPSAVTKPVKIYDPGGNCYTKHQGSGVPAIKIKMHINIVIKYIEATSSRGNYITYDDKSVDFDPTLNTWPITINCYVPSSGQFDCYLNIQGTECSECANGYGDPQDVGNLCNAYTYVGNPPTYQGAKPQWEDNYVYTYPFTSIDLSHPRRFTNVEGSCSNGCIIQ